MSSVAVGCPLRVQRYALEWVRHNVSLFAMCTTGLWVKRKTASPRYGKAVPAPTGGDYRFSMSGMSASGLKLTS